MRIQHKTFSLTVGLKHLGETPAEIKVLGSDSELLLFERKVEGNLETVNIQTYLPNTVRIEIIGGQVEPTAMSLAGIKVNTKILQDRLHYDQSTNFITIDLFHPNPFAYHMYIGNQIRF